MVIAPCELLSVSHYRLYIIWVSRHGWKLIFHWCKKGHNLLAVIQVVFKIVQNFHCCVSFVMHFQTITAPFNKSSFMTTFSSIFLHKSWIYFIVTIQLSIYLYQTGIVAYARTLKCVAKDFPRKALTDLRLLNLFRWKSKCICMAVRQFFNTMWVNVCECIELIMRI